MMGKNDPIALHVFFGLDEDNECGAVLFHSICQLCEMRSLYHRFVFAIFLIKAMHPIGYCPLSTVSLRHLIRGIALYGITDRVKRRFTRVRSFGLSFQFCAGTSIGKMPFSLFLAV